MDQSHERSFYTGGQSGNRGQYDYPPPAGNQRGEYPPPAGNQRYPPTNNPGYGYYPPPDQYRPGPPFRPQYNQYGPPPFQGPPPPSPQQAPRPSDLVASTLDKHSSPIVIPFTIFTDRLFPYAMFQPGTQSILTSLICPSSFSKVYVAISGQIMDDSVSIHLIDLKTKNEVGAVSLRRISAAAESPIFCVGKIPERVPELTQLQITLIFDKGNSSPNDFLNLHSISLS